VVAVADVIRVLVADDDPLVRVGLSMVLGADADIVVVGEAGNGAEAVESARRLRPDVVLMDIRMPDTDGLAATEELTTSRSSSSPRSTPTSTSSTRCAPVPRASWSRTPRQERSSTRCGVPRRVSRCSPRPSSRD
jgi:CheY-like chemotaxis protein